MNARERGAAIALAVLTVVLAIGAPRFFLPANLRDLALNNVSTMLVACGMLIVILIGRIDISVGSQFALCSLAAGAWPPLAIAAGAAAGSLNGALAGWMNLPAIVVTLGTMVALRGAIRWITQGEWVRLPEGLQWAGLDPGAGQTLILVLTAIGVAITGWALRNLAAMRWFAATGSSEESARLAGLPVPQIRFAAFVMAGCFTGLAALMNALRFAEVQPSAGVGLELKAIAAVVVGGASIRGGRGTVIGTIIGVVLLGMIGSALTFLGVGAYWEKAIQGGIILLAALADSFGDRRAK